VSSTGGGGASRRDDLFGLFFRAFGTRGANKNLTRVAITSVMFWVFKFLKKLSLSVLLHFNL